MRLDIQYVLLKWLRSRCDAPEHRERYQAAIRRYVSLSAKRSFWSVIQLDLVLPFGYPRFRRFAVMATQIVEDQEC